jgi:O-antigen ligase
MNEGPRGHIRDVFSGEARPFVSWAILLFLTGAFFLLQYTPMIVEGFTFEVEEMTEGYLKGSLYRQVILVLIGLVGIGSLFSGRRVGFLIKDSLGWLIIFYLAWGGASLAWSEDPALTAKRLVVFFLLCVGVAGFVKRFSYRNVVRFVFLATAFNLLVGLSAELYRGTFHPFDPEFRFSGLFHPNAQGSSCALLMLSSIALGSRESRYRRILWAVAATALFCVILTKSRTTFACAISAVAIHRALVLAPSRKAILALALIWLTCLLFLLAGDSVVRYGMKVVMLGRDSSDLATFTGRTPLWEECLKYAARKPILGYGLGGFWNARHVYEISTDQGWAVGIGHSMYLDQLLDMGVVGVGVFLSILVLAIRRSILLNKATVDGNYAFSLSFLVFYLLGGVLETVLPYYPSLLTFTLLLTLAFLAYRSPEEEGAPDERQ